MCELERLSRRERQIVGVIYRLGDASATEVWQALPDRPSRTAVRTLLRILEEKGHLRHTKKGREFIYRPTKSRGRAGESELHRVLDTFYDGSLQEAVAAYLSDPSVRLSDEDREELLNMIRRTERKDDG